MKASVKVMLSYDYCHFEVALSSDNELTPWQVNELRKEAQRLADEAVRQYKVMKEHAINEISFSIDSEVFKTRVEEVRNNKPESEWTTYEKALIKAYDDMMYQNEHGGYDYDDDLGQWQRD